MSRALLCGVVALWAGAAGADELAQVPANQVCVTRGEVAPLPDGRARVTAPKVRAVAAQAGPDAAELRFVYHGPTDESAALASGQLRRQVGLKLRAQDGCNLLYVMWRIAPKPGIVVSEKRNPGKRTHRECGANGYTNLFVGKDVPAPSSGEPHTLKAALSGRTLRVFADGRLIWQGEVAASAAELSGPVGVRTDNARVDLALYAPPGRAAADRACKPTDED